MQLDLEAEDAHEIASALWKSRKGMDNRIHTLTQKYGSRAEGIPKMQARVSRVDALIKRFEAAGYFKRHVHQPSRD